MARDPLGPIGRADRFDTGDVRPARAHLERLVEWVLPVAEELGCADQLAIPSANAAQRQIARHAEGAGLREIYAEHASGCVLGEDEQRLIAELQAELSKLTVSDLLLQTLHSISLARLPAPRAARAATSTRRAWRSRRSGRSCPCSRDLFPRRPFATSTRCSQAFQLGYASAAAEAADS